ncbi:hypothetical protein [Dermatobacter hominis]|uniref:hypothetical protein n=1 Tax=Dermatobacter hominis TaxID=2884263 RepID=UPI001D11DDE3|nr:hypothetical protein [Dermatobacter hominis]UDY37324.1 hypothetical protein LH044_07245 [Dermatobacter hominis]
MDRPTERRGRRSCLIVLAGMVLLAAACSPDPGPAPGPTWRATRLARVDDATQRVDHLGAWTDDQWFATIRATRLAPSGPSTTELAIFPRTGPGGSDLGTPQLLPLAGGSSLGPIGEHTIAVAGPDAATFFVEHGGTWTEAGSVAIGWPYQVMDMTDDWMVVRRQLGEDGDGSVRLYRIERAGTTVTATLDTTLLPDPMWTPERRNSFGSSVDLDGDLLAVTSAGGGSGGPLVQVHRHGPGGWALVQTLGDGVALQRTNALAVDDGPTVDRIAMAPFITAPSPSGVDVWADTGSGFALEQHIEQDPSLPDVSSGNLFGATVGLDGDVLAVSSRYTLTPSAQAGHPDVRIGRVQVYRHAGAWSPEQELAPYPSPFDPGVREVVPFHVQVVDERLATYTLVLPDPPDPCPFPCISIGAEAWTATRY